MCSNTLNGAYLTTNLGICHHLRSQKIHPNRLQTLPPATRAPIPTQSGTFIPRALPILCLPPPRAIPILRWPSSLPAFAARTQHLHPSRNSHLVLATPSRNSHLVLATSPLADAGLTQDLYPNAPLSIKNTSIFLPQQNALGQPPVCGTMDTMDTFWIIILET